MRVDHIKRLIELVEQSEIEELEVKRFWSTVRISKSRTTSGQAIQGDVVVSNGQQTAPVPAAPAATPTPPSETVDSAAGASPPPEEAVENLVPIVSPMVGTFYQASSPTTPAYAEVGGRVKAGEVVCIIEAMKLMNEIEAEVSGTVVKALVKNEEPVEYNQPLFMIRPD